MGLDYHSKIIIAIGTVLMVCGIITLLHFKFQVFSFLPFSSTQTDQNILAAHDIGAYTQFQSNLRYVLNNSAEVLNGLTIEGDIEADGSNLNLGEGVVTAGNVIYSISGGDGILVSGGQNPVISLAAPTAEGVTSIEDIVGTVDLEAGSNISLSTSGNKVTISSSSSFTDTDTNTTYSAGDDLDLEGTVFSLEESIDTVTSINLPTNGVLSFGGIGIGATGSSTTTSGASLIGVYTDGFSNIGTTTPGADLQSVLQAIDSQLSGGSTGDITAVGNITNGAAFTLLSPGSNLYIADTGWIGLGSAAGRIYWSNDAIDEISFLDTNVGIGKTNPGYTLDIGGSLNTTYLFLAGALVSSSASELNILDGATITATNLNQLAGVTNPVLHQGINFGGDVSGTYNNLQLGTTVVGATEIASTSVTAGTYGSAGGIPVLVIDEDGRITSASTIPPSTGPVGENPLTFLNGLTRSGDNINLGGSLNGDTRFYTGGTEVLFFDLSTGSVGLGTTAPAYKLDVNGDIGIASGSDLYMGSVGLGSTGGAALVGVNNDGLTYVSATDVQQAIEDLDLAINNFGVGSSGVWLDGGTYAYLNNAVADYLGNSASGGSNKLEGVYFADSASLSLGTDNDFNWSFNGTYLTLGDGTNTFLSVGDSGSTANFNFNQGQLYVRGDGNIGIGKTNPGYSLDIGGSLNTTNLFLAGTQVSSNAGELNILDGATITATNLNQLAGVTNPVLHQGINFSGDVSGLYNNLQLGTSVVGATELASTSVNSGTYGTAATGTLGFYPILTVDEDGRITSASTAVFTYEDVLTFNNGLSRVGDTIQMGGELLVDTRINIGNTEVTFFDFDTGRVGIGTTSPSYKLDVNGDIGIASGSDLFIGSIGLGSTGGAGFVGFNDNGLNYVSATDVQQAIEDLDLAINNFGVGSSGVWLDGGTYVYLNNSIADYLGNSASGGSNKLEGAYFADSASLSLGTDNDFNWSFNGTNLTLGDGTNTFLSVGDSGTTGNFNFNNGQFYVRGDGSIGIGTTAPLAKLDVNGNINTSGNYQIGGTDTLRVVNTTNTLLGYLAGRTMPSNPQYNTFLGYGAGNAVNAYVEQNTFVGAAAGDEVTTGNTNTLIGYYSGYGLTTGYDNVTVGDFIGLGTSSAGNTILGHSVDSFGTYNSLLGAYSDAAAGVDYAIGIGYGIDLDYDSSIGFGYQAAPTATHQLVMGGNHANGYIDDAYIGRGVVSATPNDITLNATGGSGTNIAGANFRLAGGKGTGNADGGDLIFLTSDTAASGTTLQTLTEKMRLTDEGNLAIGLTNTTYKLDVAGNIRAGTELYIGSIGLGDTASGASGSGLIGVYTNGFSNISTTTPGTNLQTVLEAIDTKFGTLSGGTGISRIGNITSGTAAFTLNVPGSNLFIADTGWIGLGGTAGRIFWSNDTTDEISFLNANVGIGKTNPIAPLDVNGNINTSGNYQIGGTTVLRAATSSIRSTFVGYGAGNTSTGFDNTIFGYNAGNGLTSGLQNTLIGSGAGSELTYGGSNVLVGYNAGNGVGTFNGDDNVGVGVNVFGSLTSGLDNTALGYYSGQNISSGNYNITIGSASGVLSGTENYALAIGYDAKAGASYSMALGNGARTTAANQLVIGDDAANSFINDVYIGEGVVSATPSDFTLNATGGSGTNITGASMILAGGKATGNADGGDIIFKTSNAGASGTTLQTLTEKMRLTDEGFLGIGTSSPIAVLDVVGNINTSGNYQIGGTDALRISENSLLIGHGAGSLVDATAQNNTFVGVNAGISVNSANADFNTALGYAALESLVDEGVDTTAIGHRAMTSFTNGFYNSSVGSDSLYNLDTGDSNSVFGYGGGYSMTTGYSNTFIGTDAARGSASYSSSNSNVIVGTGAAYNIGSNNSTNTIIGSGAGYNLSGSGNVFLGNAAGYNESGSNKLYIDNSNTGSPLIWGDFSTDVAAINGSLGIGNTIPGWSLDVTGSASINNNLITQTEGGLYYGRARVTENQFSLSNQNVGATWTARDSNRDWKSVAMSSEGKYQTAVVNSGQIYTSSDYGVTWTARDSNRSWWGVAMSGDGKYQTALDVGSPGGGFIYTSSDYGVTWTARASELDWNGVAVSVDGKYQTAGTVGDQIYTSSDYGVTWTARDSSRDWNAVAMSSDGKYQSATETTSGQIYTSYDYGVTWTARDSARNWQGIAMSSDGKYQTATVFGGQIYTSYDYGATWTARSSSRNYYVVAMSADGKYQSTVIYNGGQVYVSTDYGVTWTGKDSSRNWRSIAMSSDGKHQTGVTWGGRVYTTNTAAYLAAGGLSVGNTNPISKLSVTGLGSNTGTALVIDGNGDIWKDSSSLRYKEDIQPLISPFEKIYELDPVKYRFKGTENYTIGYVAEDLDALGLTDLVVYDNEGRPDAIKYDRLSLYNLELLKDQKSSLDTLTTSLAATQSSFLQQDTNILGIQDTFETQTADMTNKLGSMQKQIDELFEIVHNSEKVATEEARIANLTDRVSFLEEMMFGKQASEEAKLSDLLYDTVEYPDGEVLGLEDQKVVLSDLTVTGKTNLYDLGVVGDMSVGQLVVRGKESAINSLALPLQIQSEATAEIQLMAGKVIIDTKGNLTVEEEVTAKKFNVDTTEKESKSLGEGTIKIGQTEVIIKTSSVTAESNIFLTPTVATDIPLAVVEKISGTSFKVKMVKQAEQDISFNWWIVN